MQFNYIDIGSIQGDDPISISRTLKDCQDLELFELESIQHIIDFKWKTYTREFFMFKFFLFSLFVLCYYVDVENGLMVADSGKFGGERKNYLFYGLKGVCICIMLFFLVYELV